MTDDDVKKTSGVWSCLAHDIAYGATADALQLLLLAPEADRRHRPLASSPRVSDASIELRNDSRRVGACNRNIRCSEGRRSEI
jgi:hypothetical protein